MVNYASATRETRVALRRHNWTLRTDSI